MTLCASEASKPLILRCSAEALKNAPVLHELSDTPNSQSRLTAEINMQTASSGKHLHKLQQALDHVDEMDAARQSEASAQDAWTKWFKSPEKGRLDTARSFPGLNKRKSHDSRAGGSVAKQLRFT